jgi:hypothetical protein
MGSGPRLAMLASRTGSCPPYLPQKVLEILDRELLARAATIDKAEWREGGVIGYRRRLAIDNAVGEFDQREIVGRDARMRCEKSGASSAAWAVSLISERRRSSSNGIVVSIRPE